MKRLPLLVFLMLSAFSALAQTTKVRGKVVDEATGEPIPFVSVYFDNTTIGISTDLEGRYSLETRSPDAKILTASMIGYYSQSIVIQKGSFTEADFHLKQDISQLAAAFVKPDNRYIKSILKKIDEARDKHNPDLIQEDWNAGLYTKIEMDATNLEDLVNIGFINKGIGFVKEYADTSAVTGKAYLPFMITESKSVVYHSRSKNLDRENILASKISGFKDDNTISQFTGSYMLKTNFYEPLIEVFDLTISNPAASASHMLYNYFLVDSLNADGRKTYVLRFHPKKYISSPTFDGEMQIDAQDFGIKSVHVALSGESNVNWIRHINIDTQYRRLPDGRWFNEEERMFMNLSLTLNDNSKIVSAMANRTMVYEVPEFGPITDEKILGAKTPVIIEPPQENTDWNQIRPYELSDREQGIYDMVDHIQNMPFYKWTYGVVHALSAQYVKMEGWPFEYGRWARSVAFNSREGLRLQLGGRTTKDFAKKIRLGGYVAYGFDDHDLKYSGTVELVFRRDLFRKLDFLYKRDFEQLSSGTGVFRAQNIFSSLFSKGHGSMLTMVRKARARYSHEFTPDFTLTAELQNMRIWGNDAVPLQRPDGTFAESYGSDEFALGARFSYKEKSTRNYFKKTQVVTIYPVTQINLRWAFKGLAQDTYPYIRADIGTYWDTPTTVIGFGKLAAGAGIIWGSVPYPMLKLHEGNQTYFNDLQAFSCMSYYEFISDRWVNVFYEHNFNGLFLGKIPLLNKLELREVATIRGAWGTMSDANSKNAPFVLPHVSGTLETPYLEAGVGIANIFRFFRVDAFWRLTHRIDDDPSRNFAINVGVGMDF